MAAFVAGCGGSAVVSNDAGAPPDAADETVPDDLADSGQGDGTQAEDLPVERPAPPQPYARPEYQRLSQTGLWVDPAADPAARVVAAEILPFQPTYKLWSDAATKRRWVRLPPGTQIDSSDMDHWVLPVGTKLWKEFSLDGKPLETRLIERYGTGPEDYWMGAFVWNADLSDAVFAIDGQNDINGTAHDAPAQKLCGSCHRGDAGRVLGLSAIQLSRAPETADALTLRRLAALGLLSTPPAGAADYPVPGDATTAAALGYLHANCGHCHNKSGTAWSDTQMVLRLNIADRDAATSGPFMSVVGQPLQYWRGGPITLRVAPGDPSASGLVARMQSRTIHEQMPPLATEIVDPDGLDTISRWIAALPH